MEKLQSGTEICFAQPTFQNLTKRTHILESLGQAIPTLQEHKTYAVYFSNIFKIVYIEFHLIIFKSMKLLDFFLDKMSVFCFIFWFLTFCNYSTFETKPIIEYMNKPIPSVEMIHIREFKIFCF